MRAHHNKAIGEARMAITTIEDALASMGQSLASPDMVSRATRATVDGNVLEITVLVAPGKQGASVTMHSLEASDRTSHGRLIRLK